MRGRQIYPWGPTLPPFNSKQPLQRFLHLTFRKRQTVVRNEASPILTSFWLPVGGVWVPKSGKTAIREGGLKKVGNLAMRAVKDGPGKCD